MGEKKKNKLKIMRESKGLSQAQLAEKSGIQLRTLQYYEQDQLDFDHCKIEKILSVALVLECNIEDILDDEKVIDMIKKYQEA